MSDTKPSTMTSIAIRLFNEGLSIPEIVEHMKKNNIVSSRGFEATVNVIRNAIYSRRYKENKMKRKRASASPSIFGPSKAPVMEIPLESSHRSDLKVALCFTTTEGAAKMIQDYLENK